MLEELVIEGYPTTADFCHLILHHPDFIKGRYDTGFSGPAPGGASQLEEGGVICSHCFVPAGTGWTDCAGRGGGRRGRRQALRRSLRRLSDLSRLWRECQNQDLVSSEYVCPHCGYHLPIGAYLRLSLLLDPSPSRSCGLDSPPPTPWSFRAMRASSPPSGKLDSSFLMGSMGIAVGEKITRGVEYAQKHKLPLIIFSASGGARMQEGILSLMQMAKTSAALEHFSTTGRTVHLGPHPPHHRRRHRQLRLPLGDITLAEPGALIGFAGPRVIQQTIGERCLRASSGPSTRRSTASWTRSSPADSCGTRWPSCWLSTERGSCTDERT